MTLVFWLLDIEMTCVQPVRIYSGVEICQIFYHAIQGDYSTFITANTKIIKVFKQVKFMKNFKSN